MIPALFEVFTALIMVTVLAFILENPLAGPFTPDASVSVTWLGLIGSGLAFLAFFRLLGQMGRSANFAGRLSAAGVGHHPGRGHPQRADPAAAPAGHRADHRWYSSRQRQAGFHRIGVERDARPNSDAGHRPRIPSRVRARSSHRDNLNSNAEGTGGSGGRSHASPWHARLLPTPTQTRTQAPSPTRTPLAASPTTPPPTSSPTAATSPAASPIDPAELTGRITFSADNGIWTANADGSDRRQLTTDDGFDPSWSPDGQQIAYRLFRAEDDGEIWIVNADGTEARNLVNDPDFSDWGPAWSADGETIAFNSNREGALTIWLMDADGSNQRRIGTGHGEYPAWSPDGLKIVYSGGSYYDIRIVDVTGANDRALTEQQAYDMGPSWSPDGQWIAYHTQADFYPDIEEPGLGPEMEIHLVRPNGLDDHRITEDAADDSFPAWSPDSRFLMWARDGELVVARADGTGMIEIGPGNFPSWIP